LEGDALHSLKDENAAMVRKALPLGAEKRTYAR
jgi:hypothetical protein